MGDWTTDLWKAMGADAKTNTESADDLARYSAELLTLDTIGSYSNN